MKQSAYLNWSLLQRKVSCERWAVSATSTRWSLSVWFWPVWPLSMLLAAKVSEQKFYSNFKWPTLELSLNKKWGLFHGQLATLLKKLKSHMNSKQKRQKNAQHKYFEFFFPKVHFYISYFKCDFIFVKLLIDSSFSVLSLLRQSILLHPLSKINNLKRISINSTINGQLFTETQQEKNWLLYVFKRLIASIFTLA